ncbi:FadR/GntR family transcriptional regulator [Pseudomonas sp. dw_358]|uniref:FadR/GntR family transcriptional regulator n=1 Tax=Pseudomonas sp. dw_358 TaxID=2720083 RepID=UPI001BD1C31A|nr:FadR/GntR family transcriptional regulator [Pseudomonas sp. dw_358]
MPEHSNTPARKRAPGLANDLVAQLSQRILSGSILPGEKMPSESMIVREHGVSRTVVREAISKLQAAGLVETRHGIGTFVLEQAQREGFRLKSDTALSIRGILELRMGLETQAAALAARRRNDAQLATMRLALDEYQAASGDAERTVQADIRFHRAIAEATGNAYFTEIIYHLGNSMIPRTRIQPDERGSQDLTLLALAAIAEHEAIYAAIRRQDADAARAAMLLHLCNSLERFAGV